MKIKLYNTFHDTETYVLVRDENVSGYEVRLSLPQAQAAHRRLCPNKDSGCSCGGTFGVGPDLYIDVDHAWIELPEDRYAD